MKQLKDALDSDMVLKRNPDMTGSVSVVTGADSDIGLSIASLLVHLNSTVIMTCSTPDSCSAMAQSVWTKYPEKAASAIPMQMDLGDLRSVRSFVDDF